jgi:hypothetical protein
MKPSKTATLARLHEVVRNSASGARSLRFRMGASLVLTLTVVMVGVTILSVFDSRREQAATERTHAVALLDHLAQMTAFRVGEAPARRELETFSHYLRGAGIQVDMIPIPSPGDRDVAAMAVAERLVTVGGAPFLLLYTVDEARSRIMVRRTIFVHLWYGLLAIGATLAIAEWMLRRYVLFPLGVVENQLHRVGAGHGWLTLVPEVDREFDSLATEVRALGPSLERQVWEWINADRRANVALILSLLRGRTAETFSRAAAALEDLTEVRPDLADRLRHEIGELKRAVSDETLVFKQWSNPNGSLNGLHPSRGELPPRPVHR